MNLKPFSGPEHRPFLLGDGPGSALLIHGFPGSPAEMRTLGEALADSGWQAQAILLPGFGPEIPNLGRYGRHEWLAATQKAWSAACRGERPWVLCGYSMGGALALLQALAQPPDYLVLISPFTRLTGFLPHLVKVARHFVKQIRPFRNAQFSDPRVKEQFARFLPGVDLEDPEIQETIREEFVLPLQPIHEILELGKHSYRQAAEIASPTLVIQGADDPLVRPNATRRLIRRIDPALLTYFEVAGGHDLLADGAPHNGRVIDLVVEHLEGLQ